MASRALLAVLGAAVGANAITGVLSPGGTVYSYVNGGQDWKTATPLCGTSVVQSPINVAEQVVTFGAALAPLNVSYGATSDWMLEVTANYLEVADIDTVTTGADIATANAFSDGLTLADGTFLPLNQFHFHTPSEHTINGQHFPLEMHMVHKLFHNTTTNAIIPASQCPTGTLQCGLLRAAVIGIVFGYSPDGTDQPFMGKLTTAFNGLAKKNFSAATTFSTSEQAAANQFALQTDVFGTNGVGTANYFNYNGSLTTPNCNEGITWFLMAKPMTASPAQILSLTRALAVEQGGFSRGADNRLVQPLGNRSILASFAAPPVALISATTNLNGVTKAMFTPTVQTAFIAVVAGHVSVLPSKVTITSFDEFSSRRRLLATSLSVQYTVAVPASAKSVLAAQLSAAAASPTFVAAMGTATGSTGVSNPALAPKVSAAPAVKSAVAAVVAAAVLALAF